MRLVFHAGWVPLKLGSPIGVFNGNHQIASLIVVDDDHALALAGVSKVPENHAVHYAARPADHPAGGHLHFALERTDQRSYRLRMGKHHVGLNPKWKFASDRNLPS